MGFGWSIEKKIRKKNLFQYFCLSLNDILHWIDIPLPTESGRREMFQIYLKSVKLSNDIDWDYLVKNSEGYSGADICNVKFELIDNRN